jgi:hypothetical protein
MKLVAQKMEKDAAMDLMAELIASGKSPEIRYHPDGNGSTTNEYAVYIPESDVEKEREGHDEDSALCDEGEESSIFSCPRCEGRRITYPEDRGFWLVFILTLPVLGIPGIIYGLYLSAKGSRKRCGDCLHTWRSKP